MENVVSTIEVTGLFNRGDVRRLLDHADQSLVAGSTTAVDAGFDVGDVVADRTKTQAGFHIVDGGGQGFRIVIRRAKNMERQSLGGFAANSGKLLQLIDEPGHWLGKFRHKSPGNSFSNSGRYTFLR